MTEPFASLPFFRHLSVATRAKLAAACLKTRYPAGAVVFGADQWLRGLLWLREGAAEFSGVAAENGAQTLSVLPGEAIGEAALFQAQRATATLTTTRPTEISLLTRESFLAVMNEQATSEKPALDAINEHAAGAIGDERTALVFPGQRAGEQVQLRAHRHLWALCRQLWLPALALGLPLMALLLLPPGTIGWLALLAGAALAALIFLYQAVEWWNDLLIISNQRVINIARTISGLHTQVSEAALNHIQQVSADYPRGDPLARLLNYGTLELRTTGDAGSIRLRHLHAPRALQRQILAICARHNQSRHDEDEDLQGAESPAFWRAELAELLGEAAAEEAQAEDYAVGEDRVYRKHPLVWFAHIWLGALVCLFGLALFALWPSWAPLRSLGGIGLALAACVTVIGGLWAYLMDWDWRRDLLILDRDTITLHHRRPLWLQSERDVILLERVDNVTSRHAGLLQMLWNYGEIRLALMGDDTGDIKRFSGIPKPQRVQQEISRRQEALFREQEARAQNAQKVAIHEALAEMNPGPPAMPPHDGFAAWEIAAEQTSPVMEPMTPGEELPPPPPSRPNSLPE